MPGQHHQKELQAVGFFRGKIVAQCKSRGTILRAILIDPKPKTVVLTDTTGELDDLYRLLGCASVEVIMLSETEALYVDEEGLFADEPGPFFAINGFDQPQAGRGLIVGQDAAGHHVGTRITIQEVRGMLTWPNIELVGFEPISGSATIRGQKMPMIGNRAVFRKKDGQH
jgi:hypothetical protein